MSDIAIRVEGLGKRYRLGRTQKYKALRDVITHALSSPFRRSERSSQNIIWALKDVSFDIRKGEAVGIIGRNGAGKTTALKILSRIVEPTTGRAIVRGRVGSLLEVGTGFHPELTGRENIFLNGAILGMKKAEIARKFDSIVEFAEMEQFIDTVVKYYSTGMYVRLAFAVAAHLEPDILLVDEVLAVGDASFQKKCLGKMEDVARGGRTILFVSHNMGAVKALCTRAIWIDGGQIARDGDVESVVSNYFDRTFKKDAEGQIRPAASADEFRIERVVLKDRDGKIASEFAPGDDLTIELHYHAPHPIERPYFWVGIVSQFGGLFGANMLLDGHAPREISGHGSLSCTFRGLPLVPQTYTIRMGVRAKDGVTKLIPAQEAEFFQVVGSMKDIGYEGELAEMLSWDTSPILLPYEWRMPDGRIVPVQGAGSKKLQV